MVLPELNGSAHFRLEIVALVDADDAAERARDVVQELLSDFETHAEFRHVGRERPPKIVMCEAFNAACVERELAHAEARERLVGVSSGREEERA